MHNEVATNLIKLFTCYPCAGGDEDAFGLALPPDLCEASYQIIVKNVEFRRKCMNQGFDNLLELLAMHHDVLVKAHEQAAVLDKHHGEG